MGGFKNDLLNFELKQGIYEQLCKFIIKCSELMVLNCTSNDNKIENDEEKITAHLTEKYLNNIAVRNAICENKFPLKFINESLEKFDVETNTFIGRVDIKVVSLNWLSCENNDDYYTIECKRIDGYSDLNKKYITQGVARFVLPPIKYQSFHNKNIMFGYIVRMINIVQNTAKIDAIHKTELSSFVLKDIQYIPIESNDQCCVYESGYNIGEGTLSLKHIFYDFSGIVI